MGNKQYKLVGAPRFELGTSCAQGRRATRLRYAPTVTSILAYFCRFLEALRESVCHGVAWRFCGVTFSRVEFAFYSRSLRPYVTINLAQAGFRGCTSERKQE